VTKGCDQASFTLEKDKPINEIDLYESG